jgi:hypothetical protein
MVGKSRRSSLLEGANGSYRAHLPNLLTREALIAYPYRVRLQECSGDSLEIDGVDYNTVSNAARELKVSVKTVNEWIRKKIIDRPPTIEVGLKTIQIFPPQYLDMARSRIADYKKDKRQKRGA